LLYCYIAVALAVEVVGVVEVADKHSLFFEAIVRVLFVVWFGTCFD
jgi:hypothetical protein